MASDPYKECAHPAPPLAPYTDAGVAGFIHDQARVIDKCRSLLGYEVKYAD